MLNSLLSEIELLLDMIEPTPTGISKWTQAIAVYSKKISLMISKIIRLES